MKTKNVKVEIEGFGSYLGMEKGCFTVKNREGQIDKITVLKTSKTVNLRGMGLRYSRLSLGN